MKKTFCDRCGLELNQGLDGMEEVVENFRVGIVIKTYAGATAPELCSACVHALAASAGNRGSPDPLMKPSNALKAAGEKLRLDVEG